MANDSSTGFGLRPLRKVGQNDNNAGLGEYKVASAAAAIYHQELVQMQATGYILSAGAGGPYLLGSLNGAFYTDPTTSKPTWSSYAPQVTTSDPYTALVNDDPHQMFEMMTLRTDFTNPGTVGATADIVVGTGATPSPFYSANTLGAAATAADTQMKILGLTRDINNQDVSVAGSVWRCMINEHLLGNNSLGV